MEKMRVDPAAAGVAAYDLVLVERGALSVDDAQIILRDSIDAQSRIMDTEWAPVNEAAAMLLTRFSEAVHRQHRGHQTQAPQVGD